MSAAEPTTTLLPTEVVALADLRPHPENYRVHPPDEIEHIKTSLTENGQYRNVVIARDGTLLAGHGVAEAAAELGWEEIVVIRLDVDPDSPEAWKVMIGDNEIGRLAEVDDRKLTEGLRRLAAEGENALTGTGFDLEMLSALVFVTRPMSEIRTMDEAAQWVGLPGFEPPAGAGTDKTLVLHFETDEARDEAIAKLGVVIAKKMRETWSANYPPREKQDLASLRFE